LLQANGQGTGNEGKREQPSHRKIALTVLSYPA